MAINFSFTLPTNVSRVFGIKPENYNLFGLEEYVFKGVQRNPDWICDELEYWNKLRGRSLEGWGWEADGGGADDDHFEGDFYKAADDKERKQLALRYLEAGLPVPEFGEHGEFGAAFPELQAKVIEEAKQKYFKEMDFDPNDPESQQDWEDDKADILNEIREKNGMLKFIDANSNCYLGNLKEKLEGLSEDDKITVYIHLKADKNMCFYIDKDDGVRENDSDREWKWCKDSDVLTMCEKDGKHLMGMFVSPYTIDGTILEDTSYVDGKKPEDVVFKDMEQFKTTSKKVEHAYNTNDGTKTFGIVAFMTLSVKDILNSPSKGERVLLNIFNGGEDEDTYGYYY
jgi:hypothetical protein